MRIKVGKVIVASTCILTIWGTAAAHVGPTDSHGCHRNPTTRRFHCHNTTTFVTAPVCPAGQHFSDTKNECVCSSGMEKTEDGVCVCKPRYIPAGRFCAKLPARAHATASEKSGWACNASYEKKGNSCVNTNVTVSNGTGRKTHFLLLKKTNK